MLVNIPTGAPIFEGEMATYWFDEGILVSRSKSTKRTVESIRNNVAFVKQITNNKRMPLLIYLANSPVPDKETRKFSAEQLRNVYTAMAMVSNVGLAKFIMNLLFRFKAPPIPMKSFADDEEAREWLKQFL